MLKDAMARGVLMLIVVGMEAAQRGQSSQSHSLLPVPYVAISQGSWPRCTPARATEPLRPHRKAVVLP